MHRAHQLALGAERDLADALESARDALGQPRFRLRDEERAFGRIALDRPFPSSSRRAALFARSRRRAARSTSDQDRVLDAAVDEHLALGPVARAGDVDPPGVTTSRTVISFFVSVPVLSER